MKLRTFAALMIASLVIVSAQAIAAADEARGLAAELSRHYKLTTVRVRFTGALTGAVLFMKKDGVLSFAEKDGSFALLCPNEYREGGLHSPQTLACTSLAPNRRFLNVSEPVCVTGLDISEESDTVSLNLVTCAVQPRPGNYRATIVFRFSAGALARATPLQVEQVISQLLAEKKVDSPVKGTKPGAAADVPAGPVADNATLPSVPPPRPSERILEGQTADQVRGILGDPNRIADLNSKVIYFYSDLKVIFIRGRVSKIERF